MMTTEAKPQSAKRVDRRPDLQGMRAVAVLAVFADHLFNWPSGGFVGVDVFFVLSGFFITGLLIRERTRTHGLSFQNFYVRRVKRILPSALLVLVVTVAGAYALFTPTRAKDTLLDALYAAVFGANFRFEAIGADYFQQGLPPSPIQHYWSLSIEEQFYFVWPAVLVALFALTRKARKRGDLRRRQWGLFAGMGIIVAASFGWAMWLSGSDPNAAYFSTFTRVWELGVGALLAIAGVWLARIPTSIRPALAYAGLAGVVASLFVIDSTTRWPAPWAVLPVLSTALVVASFHESPLRGMQLLDNRVMRWFGDTSYTLYLWHWPVIILLWAVMPKGWAFYGIAIAVALALTAVTYHFYENPIRRSRWLLEGGHHDRHRIMAPSRWALVGAVMVAAVVVSILHIAVQDKRAAAMEAAQGVEDQSVVDLTGSKTAPDPCFGAPAMVTAGCVLRKPDAPLKPSVDRMAADRKGFECLREKEDIVTKQCTFGYRGTDAVRIALVGDSHAAALLPALWPILDKNKWQLDTYLIKACQPLIDPSPQWCEHSDVGKALIDGHYAMVLTMSSRIFKYHAPEYLRAWAPVIAAGSRIVAVADNPQVSDEAMACLGRSGLGGGDTSGDCHMSRAEGLSPVDPIIATVPQQAGASLIDLTPYYCTADVCPMVIGNVIVYQDRYSHLTATFAKTLAPILEGEMQRVLNEPAVK